MYIKLDKSLAWLPFLALLECLVYCSGAAVDEIQAIIQQCALLDHQKVISFGVPQPEAMLSMQEGNMLF